MYGPQNHILHHPHISQPTSHKNYAHDKYSRSGIYKLTCPDCHKAYVGQTGRQFSTHYKEHKTAWCKNSNTSNFAKHLIEEAHSFGPMNKIMEIIHCHKKGAHLNTIEKFHIHTEFAKKNHLNDPQTVLSNAIFDTLIKARPTIKPSYCPTPNPPYSTVDIPKHPNRKDTKYNSTPFSILGTAGSP